MRSLKIILFVSFFLLWMSSHVLSKSINNGSIGACNLIESSQTDDLASSTNDDSFDFAEFDFEESNKGNSDFNCEKILPFVNARIISDCIINSASKFYYPYSTSTSKLQTQHSYLQVFRL